MKPWNTVALVLSIVYSIIIIITFIVMIALRPAVGGVSSNHPDYNVKDDVNIHNNIVYSKAIALNATTHLGIFDLNSTYKMRPFVNGIDKNLAFHFSSEGKNTNFSEQKSVVKSLFLSTDVSENVFWRFERQYFSNQPNIYRLKAVYDGTANPTNQIDVRMHSLPNFGVHNTDCGIIGMGKHCRNMCVTNTENISFEEELFYQFEYVGKSPGNSDMFIIQSISRDRDAHDLFLSYGTGGTPNSDCQKAGQTLANCRTLAMVDRKTFTKNPVYWIIELA